MNDNYNPNDPTNLTVVTVGDGKYTYVQRYDGGSYALRYGQQWQDCTGDNLVLCLAQEIETLKETLQDFKRAYDKVIDTGREWGNSMEDLYRLYIDYI